MFSSNNNFIPPSKAVEKRIDNVISKLTLKDKISLLGGNPNKGATISVERAGIPELKMADGPVGVHWWCDSSTAYPALICAASTWDTELINRMGIGLGRDARARGVHILLAPGVNIYRSPLCGRNFEYFGEDPFLTSQLVVQYISGVQSMGVSAVVKHYAVNYQEFDRHNVSSDVDERTLHEIYLPAFRAAVQEGGCGCIMTAYNLVNGVHCSEHNELINKILKEDWGFDGVVMSDWCSTYSAVDTVNCGLDLEMPFARWLTEDNLLSAVKGGCIEEKTIDDKIRRLTRLAVCFGWLDNEQKDNSIPLNDPETARIALDVARNGIVLLKNEDSILPLLRDKIKKIAVVGPFIHPGTICGGGSAYTEPNHLVSILDGIRFQAGVKVEVTSSCGPNPYREWLTYSSSLYCTADGLKGLEGEYFDNDEFTGTPVLIRTDPQIDLSWMDKEPSEKAAKKQAVRWTGRIHPEVDGDYDFYSHGIDCEYRIWIDDCLLVNSWDLAGNSDTRMDERLKICKAFEYNGNFSRELKGNKSYKIKLELRKVGRSAKIHFGWENSESFNSEFKTALDAVKHVDAAIVCVGFGNNIEGEGFDRPFGLHKKLENFINAVASVNKNIVVLLQSGGSVDVRNWLDNVKGLLQVWYPGQEGGTAIGEIIFGDISPSGKLPITFERHAEDNSSFKCYYDDDGDNRVQLEDGIFCGYRHYDRNNIMPLFPFGFGLSYTSFLYENLKLSTVVIDNDSVITVSFDIINTGERSGAETAQLYITDLEPSLPRPIKELKGFKKIYLGSGERKTVIMEITIKYLQFYNLGIHEWIYEPGRFKVHIGASSNDIKLCAEFIGV